MKYITALSGLEFYSYHGLYPEEKQLGQVFRVDVKVTMELDRPIETIADAVNYEILYATVSQEMAIRQDLIETVAQRTLRRLEQHFGKQASIEVTIYKPNPAGVFKSGVAAVTLSV